MDRLFRPFVQAPAGMRRGGTGLGLVIARQLIGLMGGELSVASRPRVGSRFYFSLRLPGASSRNQRLAGSQRREIISLAGGQTIHAMVVDDVPANRAVLAELLAQAGCQVSSAESGEMALELLERAGQPPRIMFIDIMMPNLDGVATARRIIQRHGRGTIKLAATTAVALRDERVAYLAAGFDEVISKPIQAQRIYQCLADLLGAELEYAAPVEEDDADLVMPPVPDLLTQRLRTAAKLHQITDLKTALRDIEEQVPRSRDFSRRLRRHLQAYDMPAILRVLDQPAGRQS
jgi:CheY-like chemotaxis protein